jgi:hypothetical protein
MRAMRRFTGVLALYTVRRRQRHTRVGGAGLFRCRSSEEWIDIKLEDLGEFTAQLIEPQQRVFECLQVHWLLASRTGQEPEPFDAANHLARVDVIQRLDPEWQRSQLFGFLGGLRRSFAAGSANS